MRVDQWKVLAAFLLDDQDGSTTASIEKSNHFDVTACCATKRTGYKKYQYVQKALAIVTMYRYIVHVNVCPVSEIILALFVWQKTLTLDNDPTYQLMLCHQQLQKPQQCTI